MENRTIFNPNITRLSLIVLMFVTFGASSFSQNDSILASPIEELLATDTNEIVQPEFNAGSGDKLLTSYGLSEIDLKKGEIISNVLKVFNNSTEEMKFRLDVLHPGSWNQLTDPNKIYTCLPADTLFIPIVLIPSKLINGNTEVIVNTFLIDLDDQQFANNFFILRTKKSVSWKVSVEPSSKFYFKNKETTKDFIYRIENTGNYKQNIFVNYNTLKGDLMLLDSNDNMIKNPNITMSLNSNEDTTLSYKISTISDRDRNHKKISTNGYLPNTNLLYKKYSLFINSSEPKGIDEGSYKKGNKVDFIKLPNETRIDEYGYPYFPLVVEANMQNILDGNSFMSINMRGFKKLNDKASLAYFSQLNYSKNFYGNEFLANSPWYVGYFDDKKTIEVGQVSGNIIGITGYGKGIKASYNYLEKHKTGLFYVKGPGLFGERRNESYGLTHKYTHNEFFNISAKAGRQFNYVGNRAINAFSLSPHFNIKRKHFIGLIGAVTQRTDYNINAPEGSQTGFLFGGNYSTGFFNKKLKFSLGGRYNDRNFSSGFYKRLLINHRSSYALHKRWDVYLSNNYQNINTINTITNSPFFKQEIATNNLVFSNKSSKGSFQPGMFFDYRDYLSFRSHNRGLSFRYSTYDFLKNFMVSTFIKAGYSLPVDEPNRKDFFTLQFSSLLRHKVWSFTTRYNYGAFYSSLFQSQISDRITPQSIRLSLLNQHQFKNRHFILQSSIIYNYNNVYSNHALGLFPELFFFSNNGWRFSLNTNYSFNSSKYGSVYANDINLTSISSVSERKYNNNVMIGVGIKKEFGVPVPFIKHKSASLNFVSFYDINGNGIKEKDEPAIENIVIRLASKEVITNESGKSAIKNIPTGTYALNVFSLEKLKGWFPNTEDSLQVFANNTCHVPFVRGVKVYGDVVLDRQKIAIADTSKPFDLSRIKITATNGKTYNTLTDIKGRYEFYMPNGDYIITVDESILGEKYKLTRNNIPLTLKNSQDGVYVSFYIVEKRKKVIIKDFGNE